MAYHHRHGIDYRWPDDDDEGPLRIWFDFAEVEPEGIECTRITISPINGGGIGVVDLPRLSLTRLFRQARVRVLSERAEEMARNAATLAGRPRRGRPPMGREHLLEVAAVYNAAESSDRPVLAVMERFNLVRSTANNQIRRCRDEGLIGPAPNSGHTRGA